MVKIALIYGILITDEVKAEYKNLLNIPEDPNDPEASELELDSLIESANETSTECVECGRDGCLGDCIEFCNPEELEGPSEFDDEPLPSEEEIQDGPPEFEEMLEDICNLKMITTFSLEWGINKNTYHVGEVINIYNQIDPPISLKDLQNLLKDINTPEKSKTLTKKQKEQFVKLRESVENKITELPPSIKKIIPPPSLHLIWVEVNS